MKEQSLLGRDRRAAAAGHPGYRAGAGRRRAVATRQLADSGHGYQGGAAR